MYVVALIAAITCTFGNLAAYGQTNIKRLLAYSTIAPRRLHDDADRGGTRAARHGTAGSRPGLRLAVDLRGHLSVHEPGAFAVVAFLRNAMRSEEIADYAGLVRGRRA